jgi:hypothetical protein
VVLRYFQHKSMQQVGSALRISEHAAKKRVSRAVERMRDAVRQRGIVLSAGAMLATIHREARPQPVPADLAARSVVRTFTILNDCSAGPSTASIVADDTLQTLAHIKRLAWIPVAAVIAILAMVPLAIAAQRVLNRPPASPAGSQGVYVESTAMSD